MFSSLKEMGLLLFSRLGVVFFFLGFWFLGYGWMIE